MIDIEEFNSEKIEIIKKKDFEIVSVLPKKENEEISILVKNKLSEKYKNPKYKILVYKNNNIIVLVENKEQIDYLKQNLKNVKFSLYKETPKPKTITKFELDIQKWCNEIQKYLENIFGFKGVVKIKAAGLDGKLLTIDIVITGKGTNDKIVKVSKELSNDFTDDWLAYNNDEMFAILNDYYKS